MVFQSGNGGDAGKPEEHELTKAELDDAIAQLTPDRNEREKVTASIMNVTPAMAEKWLENNPANRNVSDSRVAAYAAEMLSGNWRINNQGIAIGANGELFDGQHRLWAIVNSKKTVPMLVVTGLLPGARTTIDKLKPRTLGHELTMFFNIPRGSRVATTLNHIRLLTSKHKGVVLMGQMLTELEKYRSGVAWATMEFAGTRLFDKGYIMAPMAYAYKSVPKKVELFAEKLRSGENMKGGDPEYALRTYLIERLPFVRETVRLTMMKVLAAIHASLRGEQLRKLQPSNEALKYFAKAHGEMRSIVEAEESSES